MYFHDVTTVGV